MLITSMVVLGGAPGAAHAEKVATADAIGDAVNMSMETPGELFTAAPEHTAVDITRTVIAHGARRLSVDVDYRDMTRRFAQSQLVHVRTPQGRFDIQVARNTGEPASVRMSRRRDGEPVRCAGLRASYDPTADRIGLSIPRACLGRPEWVRVAVGSSGVDRSAIVVGAGNYQHLYFDDAHTTGASGDHGMSVGPKVRPG